MINLNKNKFSNLIFTSSCMRNSTDFINSTTSLGNTKKVLHSPKINESAYDEYQTYVKNHFFSKSTLSSSSNQKGCALYGFSQPRAELKQFLTSSEYDLPMSTIDYCNSTLGLCNNLGGVSGHNIEEDQKVINEFLRPLSMASISAKKLQPFKTDSKNPDNIAYVANVDNRAEIIKDNKFFSDETVLKWAEYLNAHRNKVDLFTKVHDTKRTETEKEQYFKNVLFKNIRQIFSDGALTRESVDRLTNFVKETGIFQCKNIDDYIEILMNHTSELLANNSSAINILNLVIKNHFFRNTSKLGLDFFESENFDIIFNWSNCDKSTISTDDIHIKKFKARLSNPNDIVDTYEPITFSEIRHIEKNSEQFSKSIHRVVFSGDNDINFSKGFNGDWFTYQRNTLLSMKKA